MAVKIYLSPAAHETDHRCSAVAGCSENYHANRYLDELTPYLDACGIEWKRHAEGDVGSAGVKTAVRESNAWGADLHYVVHTNGANGQAKGSRPIVYPSGNGKEWAETILRHRREIYPYPCKVNTSTELYEITQTKAVCVYEELIFHDCPEDAVWLHEHLRELAAQTAKAFCEIWGLAFVDPYAAEFAASGDVDGDGAVTTTDARLILQHAAEKTVFPENKESAADVDGDGQVTTTDARMVLERAAGKR